MSNDSQATPPAPPEQAARPLPILKYFKWDHLPPHLQAVSQPFGELAERLAAMPCHDIAERVAALRKLLEAKDAAVRSVLPPR